MFIGELGIGDWGLGIGDWGLGFGVICKLTITITNHKFQTT